jgi:NAD(P)H dehydrogenase (quinone)
MDENVLIVYCHPYRWSFTHSVLDAVVRGVRAAGDKAQVCDLYADGFDPVMRAEELKIYSTGEYVDPLVGWYVEQLQRANRLVLIAPVWWNDIPAMLRGWFDKVMLSGYAWTPGPDGLVGKLQNIRRVDLYSTSDNSTEYTRDRLGDGLQKTLLDGTCWQLGIEKNGWHNLGSIGSTTTEERKAWLAQVERDQQEL